LECRRRGLLLPAQRESSSPRSPQQGGTNGNNGGRLGNDGLSRSSKRANEAKSGSEAHLIKDAKIGCEALEHVLDSTWWEQANGLGLRFWRCNAGAQRTAARDGVSVFVRGALPGFMNKSRPVDQMKLTLLASKIGTVRKRGCIKAGPIKSLADFFDVPKGDDIRMVCNGTSSGLNDALLAPSFYLPTADAAGRLLSHSSFCVDLDLGEMFLNFPMDETMRPYAGMDLTQLAPEFDKQAQVDANGGLFEKCVLNENGRFYERWERLFVGMRPSPYNAVRYFYWAEEFARGNPLDLKNAVRCDEVWLNLPGDDKFNPTLPMVLKWNLVVDQMDDLRASGCDSESAWQVVRQVASRLQHLGIQDAARKRRLSTQKGGAWAGCDFQISPSKIGKTVTQEKWDKARGIALSVAEKVLGDGPIQDLDYKLLEQQRGFLVHLTMTFASLVPFLKGIHLTLDSWRVGRKEDGWKMTNSEWRLSMQHQAEQGDVDQQELAYLMAHEGAPKTVRPVPRLANDVRALLECLSQETPPSVTLRSKSICLVKCGFGDASGKGFGSTFGLKESISYRIGVWQSDHDGESSNWREFANVVESLEEEEASSGRLENLMVSSSRTIALWELLFTKAPLTAPSYLTW
jgi:hypothetical protein